MSEDISVSVRRLIVHILDTNLHMPVLSDGEHPADDEISGFVEKHISRVLKDDNLKTAYFKDENNKMKAICESVPGQYDQFNRFTAEIAGMLFDIIKKNVDIPPADLICCLFELDNVTHLGILKLNYKESYIHYVNAGESGKVNSIIKQKTTLPGESQKVDECALINLRDLSIKLLEKKYEINGEKLFYFSALFLNCSTRISDVQRAKVFKKATDEFSKTYYEEDFRQSSQIKRAVVESIHNNEAIDVEEVAGNVFRQNPEMKKAYIEHIEKAGIKDKSIAVSEKLAERTFWKQKIKTDTGIEINIPIEYCSDEGKIEFINNPDGTISILLKNIGKITDV